MSTLLINTTGGSKFSESTSVFEGNTTGLSDVVDGATSKAGIGDINIALTNTDKKPELVPIPTVIDVVNNFSWYAGPKATEDALAKVPCVFLTEREQLLSSLVSGALYYLNASAQAVNAIGKSDFVKSILGKLTENGGDGGSAGNFLPKEITDFTGGTESDKALLAYNNLKSLEGIYFTKPTGFNYRLPIYGSPSTNTGEWGEGNGGAGGKLISGIVDKAKEFVEEIASAVNFAQPGVYIEKPRYFDKVKGREESITFPLVNTVKRGTHSPVQQNYELLWLLAFQNKPYKTSFARTPPPKIYSVSVPGQFSMPYAYISSMEVKFMGTVRKAKVFVPSGSGEGAISSKQITTPVPEAYQVTLKFTSLIGDYGNSMISDAFTPSIIDNKVTIGNK
jgi:hypothetical protein